MGIQTDMKAENKVEHSDVEESEVEEEVEDISEEGLLDEVPEDTTVISYMGHV